MSTLQRIANTENLVVTEGPHWDTASQNLYFVDALGKGILRYSPATQKVTKVSFDKAVTFIIPVEGKQNQFIIALDNEIKLVSWDGESDKVSIIETLVTTPNPFNDAKCDSTGRLWAGTHNMASDIAKSPPVGILYSFDSKKHLKSHVDKIRLTNGMAFNDKTKKMFYIDSLAGSVDQFDFDINSGTISNRRVWFTLSKHGIPGIPDGMTIDIDGNLWVAVFGGGRVLKIDGNKCETLLDTIDIPAEQVTSVAFGGPNLDELYVTTGNVEIQGKKPTSTANGALFKVTGLRTKGLPGVNFKLS